MNRMTVVKAVVLASVSFFGGVNFQGPSSEVNDLKHQVVALKLQVLGCNVKPFTCLKMPQCLGLLK